MASRKPRNPDWYILKISAGPEEPPLDLTLINMGVDPGYADLLDKEKKRELVSPHPTVVPRACLKQTPDMLVEDYWDEKTQMNKKRFKEELIEALTDSEGRLWVSKDRSDIVKRVARVQRALGRTVKYDDSGLIPDEELPESERNRTTNKGGRPTKDSYQKFMDVKD